MSLNTKFILTLQSFHFWYLAMSKVSKSWNMVKHNWSLKAQNTNEIMHNRRYFNCSTTPF